MGSPGNNTREGLFFVTHSHLKDGIKKTLHFTPPPPSLNPPPPHILLQPLGSFQTESENNSLSSSVKDSGAPQLVRNCSSSGMLTR